jgi:hypothetical protein
LHVQRNSDFTSVWPESTAGHVPYALAPSMLHGDQKAIHPHEHLLDPAVIDVGRYRIPSRPGHSPQMQPETLVRFAFAAGAEWRAIGTE